MSVEQQNTHLRNAHAAKLLEESGPRWVDVVHGKSFLRVKAHVRDVLERGRGADGGFVDLDLLLLGRGREGGREGEGGASSRGFVARLCLFSYKSMNRSIGFKRGW